MLNKSKLKREEYQDIYRFYEEERWSIRKISRYLGRNVSTISRELQNSRSTTPGIWWQMTSYEKGSYRYERSKTIRSKARVRPRLKTERIKKIVIFILCRWSWSPETISKFLSKYGVCISSKAIYNFIKKERPVLKEHLLLKGKVRRQRVTHSRGIFKSGVPERKSIHERPSIFALGQVSIGHWEIDTVHSKRGGSMGVLTLKELASKRSFYFLIPDLSARSIMDKLVPFFRQVSPSMRLTITADNGPENAELHKLEKIFSGIRVYYCDPYKAWQRARVENSNGRLRQFFPKGTDFGLVSENSLRAVEYKISGRPMKSNNFVSAGALYNQFLKAA